MIDWIRELTALSQIASVSSCEDAVGSYFEKLISPFADKVRRDAAGNVLALKSAAKKGAPNLLLDAHMDEIGFLVSEYCPGGFLKLARVGGLDPAVLPATELILYGTERIRAVVASKPPHLIKESEREKKQMLPDLFIDTGLSEDEAKKLIPIGTPAGFAEGLTRLQNGRVSSRGLDNRVSGLCLAKVFELLDPSEMNYNLIALWSVQEEVGGLGAKVASFAFMPDLAICVDVSFAEFPGAEQRFLRHGGGAGISFSDTLSRTLTKDLIRVADSQKIAVQILAEPGETGTNAHEMQVSGRGIPSAILSIPLSYMHTPSEVVELSDLDSATALLCAYAKNGAFAPGEVVLVG